MVNKLMISMNIFAYLLIIIIDFLSSVIPFADLIAIEIVSICRIAVYAVCNLILALIVNQLVTKILAITAYSESLARALMAEVAAAA